MCRCVSTFLHVFCLETRMYYFWMPSLCFRDLSLVSSKINITNNTPQFKPTAPWLHQGDIRCWRIRLAFAKSVTAQNMVYGDILGLLFIILAKLNPVLARLVRFNLWSNRLPRQYALRALVHQQRRILINKEMWMVAPRVRNRRIACYFS
jgi:hypothetical protein